MRNLKEILKDLKVTINVKNHPNFKKRVYVYSCTTPEEQNKFNLVADLIISSSVSFEKLEEGIIKKNQRGERFIFDLLECVLFKNHSLVLDDESEYHYRKYIEGEYTIKDVKKVLHVKHQ